MNNSKNFEGNRILYKEESYAIQGAVFEVYKEIGSGFLEGVYQECLSKEFVFRNIPFVAQPDMGLLYKGEPLNQIYRPDFVCFSAIILELKVAKSISDDYRAQLLII
jgi:GxxExxY protein